MQLVQEGNIKQDNPVSKYGITLRAMVSLESRFNAAKLGLNP
jgi:hypothetical protein